MNGQERETSARFFIQMIANIYLCKKAQEIIAKETIRRETIGGRAIAYFVIFALLLFTVNQGAFFFFKDANLYSQLGVSRKMTIPELKEWGKIKLVEMHQMKLEHGSSVLTMIKEFEDKLNVLTHPARRLSYDSFGFADGQYAWAFKSPNFILQTIIGSAIFFVICTFMSMINSKKDEVKQAFKLQIFAMIILFIWEVDLIITTQSRLNNFQIDWLDYIYTAFPIFERRELIKVIIIPCMSLVDTFVRFYVISPAERKLIMLGNCEHLRTKTNPVREKLSNIQVNVNIEQSVNAGLDGTKSKYPVASELFRVQRELLKRVLFVEGDQIMARPHINRILKYFLLK